MNPALYMVCDPQSARARSRVSGMLDTLPTIAGDSLIAGCGPGWAAAAVAPPANESTCGADIYSDGRDILIWTGDVFLPDDWYVGIDAKTPTETISIALLRKLRACGVDILAEVDEVFCGAWYDHRQTRWIIFNDKWGLIPIFWSESDDVLVVSPKAWLTWRTTGTPLEISALGVTDMIRTQNMMEDHTLIAGVHWLKPGHVICRDQTGTHTHQYWDFQYRPQTISNYDQVIDGFVDCLHKTIKRMTECTGPLMLGISGGLDSRMFLAMCHALERVPICYTAGWPFCEDVRFGRQLAKAASAPHHILALDERAVCECLPEAVIDCDGLHSAAQLLLSTHVPAFLAEHRGAVVLEGYLHGVLGGSDLPSDEDVNSGCPPHQSRWARDFLHSSGQPDNINRLLKPELADESFHRWQAYIDDAYARASIDDPLYRAEYAIIAGRSGRNDVLAPGRLRRDAVLRSPACDRLMVDWYARTPARWRRARKVYIDALRRRFPKFARIPRADQCSGLPLTESRWLREYHWQGEKIYQRWLWMRYSRVRKWGANSLACRGWAFDVWRVSGGLDVLTDKNARILNWIDRPAFMELWKSAERDPLNSVILLTLATVEVMVRWLEALPYRTYAAHTERINFKTFNQSTSANSSARVKVGV